MGVSLSIGVATTNVPAAAASGSSTAGQPIGLLLALTKAS